MTMPGLRGEEVFIRLREIDPNVKVTLSSGFTKQALIEPSEEASSVDFLHKPYKPSELQAMVDRLMKRQS